MIYISCGQCCFFTVTDALMKACAGGECWCARAWVQEAWGGEDTLQSTVPATLLVFLKGSIVYYTKISTRTSDACPAP